MQANKPPYLLLVLLVFIGLNLSAQEDQKKPLSIVPNNNEITAPLLTKSPFKEESVKDSTTTDSTETESSFLLDKIKYKAKDYVRINQKEQKIYLYNEAEIYYQDTELKAGVIILDYVKNEVYAGRLKDTVSGEYTQLPNFKQGSQEVIPDSIRFNFDTQKH